MKALKGKSLVYKFLVAAALPVFMLFIIANIVFFSFKIHAVKTERIAELEAGVSQMASQLASPVWQFDTGTVSSLLGAVLELPNITCVRLQEFESYSSTVRSTTYQGDCNVMRMGQVSEDALVESSIIFVYEGQAIRIGLLSVHADTSDLGDQIRHSLLSDLAVFLLYVIIFMIGFVMALKATVLKPLQKVEASFREYELTGERHLVEWHSSDELGRFIDAYNASVEKTRSIEATLVEQNKSLENARKSAEHARDIAESAARAKSEFLANMSHEIRTPMNAIIGLSNMMQRTHLDAKQKGYLQRIANSADILMAIINDILDFSKIEAGKLELESVEFNLDSVIEKLADVEAVAVFDRRLDLAFHVASDVPELLVGDPMRLSQVLINLISNAVKFTERGAIDISISTETKSRESITLAFMVRDTGIGISDQAQANLFNAFTQADGSTTRKFGGTGLGLAICKSLVECMGGQISVSSKLGEGSCFKFNAFFGLKGQMEFQSSLPPSDAINMHAIVIGQGRSCVVLSRILNQLGSDVTAIDSARDALTQLDQLSAANKNYLFFLDVDTAKMSFEEFVGQMRQTISAPAVPLVSIASEDVAKDLMTNNVQLTKPVLRRRVIQVINEVKSGKKDVDEVKLSSGKRLSGARILVVEDNQVNQMVAREFLEEAGATVRVADNGAEAIQRMHDKTIAYDLVLMDIHMPVVDGYKATSEIRQQFGTSLPIIALTANATTDEKKRCLEAGMDDFLTKPIESDVLLDVVQKWLYRGGFRPASGQVAGVKREEVVPEMMEENKENKAVKSRVDSESQIDWGGLAKRFSAHKQIVPKVLQSFVDSFVSFESDYEAALESQDVETLYRLAHSLKGGAANISAEKLRSSAFELESKLKDGDLSAAGECYPWAVDGLQKLLQEMRELLKDNAVIIEKMELK